MLEMSQKRRTEKQSLSCRSGGSSHVAHLGATPISDSTNSELPYHLEIADAYMGGRYRQDVRLKGHFVRAPDLNISNLRRSNENRV